jgi:ribosomal protein S18 acetylase RimI-like enzyme
MEIELEAAPPVPPLPDGYQWIGWQDELVPVHADVKYRSFAGEIDSQVFPSLADAQGCFHLMNEIAHKRGFLPMATWLIASPTGYVGTIQGIRDRPGLGAIQNLGVVAAHRGKGLGTALLLKALDGFRRCGLGRVYLEATAQNRSAVQLYRRLGFRCRKTLYRAVEVPFSRDPVVSQASASRHTFIDGI